VFASENVANAILVPNMCPLQKKAGRRQGTQRAWVCPQPTPFNPLQLKKDPSLVSYVGWNKSCAEYCLCSVCITFLLSCRTAFEYWRLCKSNASTASRTRGFATSLPPASTCLEPKWSWPVGATNTFPGKYHFGYCKHCKGSLAAWGSLFGCKGSLCVNQTHGQFPFLFFVRPVTKDWQ